MSLVLAAPHGRVLVEELESERKTSGGLILAGESDPENTARFGKIVSNGIMKGNHLNAFFSEGSNIFFGKFAGATVNHEGRKFISLLESEILAVGN